MKKQQLKKNLPVLTAEGLRLGQTHTLYNRLSPAEPQLKLFAHYLMVVNFTIGDEFYVPTDYIDEAKSDETAVWLTRTKKEIEAEQLTALPRFIAGNQALEVRLVAADPDPDKGKPLEDVLPLPPNQQ